MKMISTLIDFTAASAKATEYACWFSKETGATVNLLHIAEDRSVEEDILKEKLIDFTNIKEFGVPYTIEIGYGDYLREIPKTLLMLNADFVVAGTHGVKGVYESLFGPNMVKLVQRVSISAITVQDQTRSPSENFPHILLPIGVHENFHAVIKKTAEWALEMDAEVDVFSLLKDGDPAYNDFVNNLEVTKKYFDKHQVRYKTIVKESTRYSVGYSREILEYAEENDCGLITIMSHVSEKQRYLGNVDKTNLIMNKTGIPILCVAG